jgi:hypothetical protein
MPSAGSGNRLDHLTGTQHEQPDRHSVVVWGLWPFAHGLATDSLAEARRLNAAGFPTAAFVWAVRSAEMYLRDCVLFCHFFEETGDVDKALKKARGIFGDGKWAAALRFAEEEFGPFDEPLTTDGDNAWKVWQRWHVSARGHMVHGRMEATPEQAEWAIDFADRFISWSSQRLATSERGPLRGALRTLFEQLREQYREAVSREESDDIPQPSIDRPEARGQGRSG